MKKIIFSLLILILTPQLAFAALDTFMEVEPTDKSLMGLRMIFGSAADIIIGGSAPKGPDSIVGVISEVINIAMLSFVGFIVGFVTLQGIMNTASEGNALGRMYDTMWVPLRMALAFALVLPFGGGYSTMQLGVLWLAGNGIGIANAAFTRTIDYLESGGTIHPPPVTVKFDDLADAILMSRVCMHGINVADKYTNIRKQVFEEVKWDSKMDSRTRDPNKSSAPELVSDSSGVHMWGIHYTQAATSKQLYQSYATGLTSGFTSGIAKPYGDNACGYLRFTTPKSDATMDMGPYTKKFMADVSEAIVKLDYQMSELATEIINHANDDSLPEPGINASATATEQFRNSYMAALKTLIGSVQTARIKGDNNIKSWGESAESAGWISLGAFYWDFQRMTAEVMKLVNIKFEVAPPTKQIYENEDVDKYLKSLGVYYKTRNIITPEGETKTELDRSTYIGEENILDGTAFGNVSPGITQEFFLNTASSTIQLMMSNPDPVSGLANFGHFLIVSVELLYTGAVFTKATAAAVVKAADTVKDGLAAKVLDFTGGVSAKATGLLTFAFVLIQEAAAATKMLILLLLPIALFIAFYLPAQPLVIWILGVLGWYLLIIESVIAASLWAVSHAFPQGQGFASEQSRQGYMVMISVLFRPVLMIAGFFAGMILMIVMGKVTQLLFIPSMSSMLGGTVIGIASFAAMIAIYIAIIVQIANRCYGLTHEIPDKVLRYIGGGQENLGEAEGQAQTNKMVVAGIHTGAGKIDKQLNTDTAQSLQGKKGGEEKATPSNPDQPKKD